MSANVARNSPLSVSGKVIRSSGTWVGRRISRPVSPNRNLPSLSRPMSTMGQRRFRSARRQLFSSKACRRGVLNVRGSFDRDRRGVDCNFQFQPGVLACSVSSGAWTWLPSVLRAKDGGRFSLPPMHFSRAPPTCRGQPRVPGTKRPDRSWGCWLGLGGLGAWAKSFRLLSCDAAFGTAL